MLMSMKNLRSNSTATRRTTRSMQYYRVWIYSCNGVLGITSAIFAIFAAFVLADVRLSLLGGIELYHPTFLYAYTALILQCGVVQTIGCLGAQRLSHKLLSVYWILLLLLTIGDVVVGLVWVFKLDKVKLNLRPVLTSEFISKYSTDESFTRTWNRVQSEEHCCGVDGPLDYEKLGRAQSQHSANPNSSLIIDVESSLLSLPESCCIVIYDPSPVSSGSGSRDSLNKTHRSTYHPHEKELSSPPNRSYEFENEDRGGRDWTNTGNNLTDNPGSYYSNYGHIHNNSILNDESPTTELETDNNILEPIQLSLLATKLYHDTLIDNVKALSNASEEELTLPLLSSSFLKHKTRHGHGSHKSGSHKSPVENNTSSSSENSSSLMTPDGGDEIVEDKNSSGVGERNNKTKSKKFFPSFSFNPKKSTKTITTEEPEYATKLPVPFTCQRHPKIHSKHEHHHHHHPYYRNEDSSSTVGSNSETDIAHDGVTITSRPSRSTTEETNEIDEDLGDDENNDVESSSPSIRGLEEIRTLGFETNKISSSSSRNKRKRRKRNSQVIVESSGPDPSSVVGSNPFNFLYATAFPDDHRDEGLKPSASSSSSPRGASNIQAAYYFSSSSDYISNSYNASLEKRFHVFRHGCGLKLIQWLDHVSGIMFILGFCIIAFVKTCFLVILRTEIREMIEKIHILELDDPVSPSRAHNKDQRLSHVSHPLLAHPHRASTVSAHAYNAVLPTIKSPEGLGLGPTRFPKSYHQRRHSNIVGDRSQNHSQETVNMTLLVTNSSGGVTSTTPKQERQTEKGRSNPNLSLYCRSGMMMIGKDEFDPSVCISIPNTAKYLRRSSTCSSSANPGPNFYSGYSQFDTDLNKPGPSSRFYHHEPTTSTHHHLYHQHCNHQYYSRARPHIRNISTGAVVHQSSSTSGGRGSVSGEGATGVVSNFRSFGGESGSGGCSFSSREENEILSVSMENVGEDEEPKPLDDDEKEKERREAEIRDWAAATACTDNSANKTGTPPQTVSLGDYGKVVFNHSSDSAESNDRQTTTTTTRRNGNNNMDPNSIPMSYLGTAV